ADGFASVSLAIRIVPMRGLGRVHHPHGGIGIRGTLPLQGRESPSVPMPLPGAEHRESRCESRCVPMRPDASQNRSFEPSFAGSQASKSRAPEPEGLVILHGRILPLSARDLITGPWRSLFQ